MARETTHEARGPVRFDAEDIEERGGSIAICRCGLSDDLPLCDGSHAGTRDEDPDAVYKYEGDDDRRPRRVIEGFVYVEEEDGEESGD